VLSGESLTAAISEKRGKQKMGIIDMNITKWEPKNNVKDIPT
jgi:hypothetical protein